MNLHLSHRLGISTWRHGEVGMGWNVPLDGSIEYAWILLEHSSVVGIAIGFELGLKTGFEIAARMILSDASSESDCVLN